MTWASYYPILHGFGIVGLQYFFGFLVMWLIPVTQSSRLNIAFLVGLKEDATVCLSMIDLRRVDLHTHTHCSDGHLSPSDLVKKARLCDLSAIAITDHDTIDGLEEGRQAGIREGVEVIAGVELSVTVGGERIHLLGYFFDPGHGELQQHVRRFQRVRRERVLRILERLSDLGISLSLEAVEAHSSGGALGRPHVAEAMVAAGLVPTTGEAFGKYLGDGKSAYVSKPLFSAGKALALLHDAGGIGVLAHPGKWVSRETIQSLIDCGLDGIETVHPSHDASLTLYYRQLAREKGLLETGGSDFHRPGSNDHMGTVTIPYPWLLHARGRTRLVEDNDNRKG